MIYAVMTYIWNAKYGWSSFIVKVTIWSVLIMMKLMGLGSSLIDITIMRVVNEVSAHSIDDFNAEPTQYTHHQASISLASNPFSTMCIVASY